ncbi:MAG TPA: type II CAAX endopeptidase family protein [Anaerolineales bacterium]
MSPQKKVSLFLFLTFALSLFSYVPIIRAGTLNVNGGIFVLTVMWSPGLAAILTQLIATRSLRGMGWRFGSARWLGIAYILPILYALPVYAFAWLTGLGTFPDPVRIAKLAEEYSTSNLSSILTIYVLTSLTVGMAENLISALGEEIGWRGLFVPELSKVTSFTKTALISGIVWVAWHMPGIFLADLNDSGIPNLYAAAMYALMLIGISFPFAWLTLKSGSLWPAALLHASHNLFVQWIFNRLTADTSITPYITGEFGVGLALTSMVLGYIFWRMQRDKSLQTQPIQSQPIVQPEQSSTL